MRAPIVCLHCHQQYQGQPEDVIIHIFSEEDWFNWFSNTCPKCTEENRYFSCDGMIDRLIEIGGRVIRQEYAPDEIIDGYQTALNGPVIRLHRLEPVERNLLGYWHYLLFPEEKDESKSVDIVAELVNDPALELKLIRGSEAA